MTEAAPERRGRSFRMAALVLAVGLAGGIAAWHFETGAQSASRAAPSPPPVPVQVAAATRHDVPVYLSGLGTVQAFNTVTVHAQVDGQLQKVLFTEGQQVKTGDVLAEIDPRTFQAAVEQATGKLQQDQASLGNAKTNLARLQKLATQDFASQQALDDQRSMVAQLEAQITQDVAARDAASVQLSYTRILAPIDGRTGFSMIDAGNIVHATDATGLVVINQTRPISVLSTLPEDALPMVRAAMKAGPVAVTAFTRDGGTRLGNGTLSVIDNEIDQSTGTIQLKSTFANTDDALWPGQFVELRVQQQRLADALTIPSAALQRGQQGFFVYVVGAGDIVEARPVKPGPIEAGRAVIESGLTTGERVVTSGSFRLEPGVKVAVEDTNATAAPATPATPDTSATPGTPATPAASTAPGASAAAGAPAASAPAGR